MKLDKIQKNFRRLMLQTSHDLSLDHNDVQGLFKDDHISVKERLKVYHNNVVGSLTEVLRDTYSLVNNLVGDEFFGQMARQFIFDHPPHAGFMHGYGDGFAEFIDSYDAVRDYPYLGDVARFEWAMHYAYYAPDDDAMVADALSKIAPEKLPEQVLDLRKSATLISSPYPLLDIQAFCESDGQIDAPDLSAAQKCRLLIIRPALEVIFLPLEEDEFFMLSLLNDEHPLGAALDAVLETFPSFDFPVFLEKNIKLETFFLL